MSMKYLLLFLAPFLNPTYSISQNRKIVFEHASMNIALAKADSVKRLVFVDCYTSWCGPCKVMDAKVFTQDTVADFFNANFINVKMDMEKGEGPAMATKYKVGAYPSFLLLDAAGNEVYKFVGGMTADTFMLKIKEGMNPQNRVAVMNNKYKSGNRSKAFLREYVKLKIEMQEIELGKKVAAEYLALLTPKERAKQENWYLFGENRYSLYLSNIHSGNFNYLAGHWRDFIKANGKKVVEKKLSSSYRQIAEYSLKGWYFKEHPYSKTVFENYRKQLANTELPDKDQLIILMNIAQAAGEKDTIKMVTILADNMAAFSEENKKIVFAFATMFNGRQSALTTNPRSAEIFDKVIQTSSNEGLVSTAKAYRKYCSQQL